MTDDPTLVPLPARRIARVAVDIPLAHLDRPFDYEVPDAMDDDAVVGARVRVRFAGRLRDGFVLARDTETDAERLAPLEKVTSPEPVLSPEIAGLARAVADHGAGLMCDVLRLAVPPRHATTEKAARRDVVLPEPERAAPTLGAYPSGPSFVEALAEGATPRVAWHVAPVHAPEGDWAHGFAEAAAATVAGGRGALLLAPDARDLERLQAACDEVLGPKGYVTMTADVGPAARYRAFLAARRGDARVVVGTRAAVYAPVQGLGLIALHDDGDDLWAEPRAPYVHAREVACLRASRESTALLLSGHARTAEVASLVERGWLVDLSLATAALRRRAPVVRAAVDSEHALERDPQAHAARIPHEAFRAIRTGLTQGPVLVQVPRAGYRPALVCADCRTPARCPRCSGPVSQAAADGPLVCGWCGTMTAITQWRCDECESTRLRATRVGAERTLDELGRAFSQVPVVSSSGNKIVAEVDAEPRLVVATPGAEPRAEAGYAAAVLLDGSVLLQRPDLRAAEETLRRWANAVALVRPAEQGGTVVVVAPADARATQALVRHGEGDFAERELADRLQAHFPPAAKWVEIDGDPGAVSSLQLHIELTPLTEVLGPVALPTRPGDDLRSRLILRAPTGEGRALVASVRGSLGVRSARKDAGSVRVRVDPAQLS